MRKASEYRDNARACRALARRMGTEEQRRPLLEMAEQWEQLASDRAHLIRLHPELAIEGELDEEQLSN